jgi:hypothetical protein
MNFLYLYLFELARVLYSVCVIISHKNCFRRLSDCVLCHGRLLVGVV